MKQIIVVFGAIKNKLKKRLIQVYSDIERIKLKNQNKQKLPNYTLNVSSYNGTVTVNPGDVFASTTACAEFLSDCAVATIGV